MNGKNTSTKLRKIRFLAALFLVFHFALGTLVAQSPLTAKSPATTGATDEPVLTAGNVDTSKHPTATVNFTIEKQGSVFRQLETSDVEVFYDGRKVDLKPDALKKAKDSESVRILFVIDKSGSMRPKKGIDKLKPAQDALFNFVSNLSPVDEVAISTFGEDYTEVLPLTKVENKARILDAINNLSAPDQLTNFYSGIESAVSQAGSKEIKNIIFLSDAKEDNADFNLLKDKPAEKRRRESDLSGKLNQKGVRFFAVALGNPAADSDSQEFVDYDSMKNIATPTLGTADLIDVPDIMEESKSSGRTSESLIAEKLKNQLAEVKKMLKFSYALVFDLPPTSKASGDLMLKFNITDGKKTWKQETTYEYNLQDNKPIFGRARVLPFIISSASKSLSYKNISMIYLLMLVPLGILSLIPSVFNKFAAAAEVRKVSEAIVSVPPNSPLVGAQCPGESGPLGRRFAFRAGDTLIVCPQCGTPHHLICWAENKFQCMNRMCERRYQIPAQILTKHNVQV
jgi:Mg-chelatase subunit ChlD